MTVQFLTGDTFSKRWTNNTILPNKKNEDLAGRVVVSESLHF